MGSGPKEYSGECYIVLERGRCSELKVVKCTQGKPGFAPGQAAVKVKLRVNRAMFDKSVPEVDVEIRQGHIATADIKVEPEAL